MEDYIVSARKYRPSTFRNVVGQQSIVSTLKNAIANKHLAHSFLFCGQRGVGKTSCARILAKTINCEHLTVEGEACNKCESCHSFNEGRSLNIHELDAASNNSVDDIRGLIEQVRSSPQSGRYKVYIIDEVHMLSSQAFNAFLKTLEEPPSYAIFILATTEKHKIIPTILSRCQIFDFKRIQLKDIAGRLEFISAEEGIEAEPEALHIISEKADGSMRDALSIYDQMVSFAGKKLTYKKVIENLNILDYDYYFRITSEIIKGDTTAALLTLDEVLANGFDGFLFLTGLTEHLRNLVVAKNPATSRLIDKGAKIMGKYGSQASECTEALLFNALTVLNQCGINYKMAVNQRLSIEIALIRLCTPTPSQSLVSPESRPSVIPNATLSKPKLAPPLGHQLKEEAKAADHEGPNAAKPRGKAQEAETAVKPNFLSVRSIIGDTPISEIADSIKTEQKIPQSNAPPNIEALHLAWHEFIAEHKEKRRNLCSILSIVLPVKSTTGEETYELTLGNSVQKETVEEYKGEILQYLRTRFNYEQLQLRTVVSKTEVQNKPYTAQEKFEHMKNKNPDVVNLSSQLGLELP